MIKERRTGPRTTLRRPRRPGRPSRTVYADAAGPAPTATATAVAVPSVSVTMPSSLPSLLARPVVRPEQAFPETNVRLPDGSRYERVDQATTTECARGTSQELAALIDQWIR